MPTCRSAIDDPQATAQLDWTDLGRPLTANLLSIYRTRADHVEAIGLPTLGIRETVQRLGKTRHETLRLASLEGSNGYPRCVIFLAPDEPIVVAAVAVLGPPTPV